MEPEPMVADAMADRRCRTVLRTVAGNGNDTTSIATLTDAVADSEARPTAGNRTQSDGGTTGDRRSDDEYRQRILVALHHRHLPKLAAAGLIRYDVDRAAVRSTLGESERALLETLAAHE